MQQFTFRVFLDILAEDASTDKMITDMQSALANLEIQINQRTQPLIAQKQQLQKRLAPLLKRKQADDSTAAKQTQQSPQNQQNQQAPAGVTTPGSTGSATPGV